MIPARCFSTLGCPELSLDQVFALARRHDVEAVELRALDGTIDLAARFADGFGSPAALAQHVKHAGVRIAAIDVSLHLVGTTDSEREQVLGLMPWVEALGVAYLRVFDGGKSADAAELAEAAKTVAWWRELKRARQWRADWIVETHDSLFTAAAIQRFTAAVPDVALLWDTHHTWKKGGEDPLKTWSAIRAHVAHVHVKDSVADASERKGYRYTVPGTGEFPFRPLMQRLRADGFTGCASIEWERFWIPTLGPLDEVLQATIATGEW